MKKKQAIIAAWLGMAAVAGAAHAETRDGWYGGVSLGHSVTRLGGADIDHVFSSQNLTSSSTIEKTKTSYALAVGYRLNEFFAAEMGYVNLGRFAYTSTVTAPAADTVSGHYLARGFSFAGIGYIPLSRKWSAYLKAGTAYLDARRDANSTGAVAVHGAHKRDFDPLCGLGLTYDLTRNFSLRGGWDRYWHVGDVVSTGRGNIDQYTIGVTFHF
jgi:OmpA-OmpF porin, OOP family